MNALRIKKERLIKSWSQSQVGNFIGVSPQTVCDWEKGRSFPRHSTLNKLENLFNLTHQELFATDPDENPSL